MPPDIDNLVAKHIRLGTYYSPDEVLRNALRALAKRNDDFAAIQAGIEDTEAGRLILLGESDAEIRKMLGAG